MSVGSGIRGWERRSVIGVVLGVSVGVLVGVVFEEGVMGVGCKGRQFKIKEHVWVEFLVSVETEEKKELESVVLKGKGTGGSRMETRRVSIVITGCY